MTRKPPGLAGSRSPPKLLYKYLAVDEGTLRIFNHSTILFSDPIERFNDPFDCRLPFDFDATREEFRNHYFKIALKFGMYQLTPTQLDQKIDSIIFHRDRQDDVWKCMQEELTDHLVTVRMNRDQPVRIGVLSLAESQDNILMYSHYADGHKGICIGLSVDVSPRFFFDGKSKKRFLRHVDYIEPKEYCPPNFFRGDQEEKIVWKYFTKASQWSYENEWRVLTWEGSGIYPIPGGVLKEIIFGCDTSKETEEKVRKALKKRRNVKFLKCEKAVDRIGIIVNEL